MSESDFFNFATCDRKRALGFLRAVYPSIVIEDTAEDAGPMLDLVEADVIRIQDPLMHGPSIQVTQGAKWDTMAEASIMDTLQVVSARWRGRCSAARVWREGC